jgi:hypothetical protein
MEDVKGVYVNVSSVEGIDQTFRIKTELEKRQANQAKSKAAYTYAFLYQPSVGVDKPSSQVR